MENEQAIPTDTAGTEADKPVEDDKKDISLYDKTEAIVTRQEEANKKTEELLERQEKLYANQRLAGTSGGRVESEKVSPEKAKINQAEEFFKDTALGDAIKKTNE